MKTLKLIYRGSILFWSVVFLLTLFEGNPTNPRINTFKFLNETHDYTDYVDILTVLFHLEANKINLFEWCCDLINFIGKDLGYDYQMMNILIFVVILPTLFFNVLFIAMYQFIVIKKKLQ